MLVKHQRILRHLSHTMLRLLICKQLMKSDLSLEVTE